MKLISTIISLIIVAILLVPVVKEVFLPNEKPVYYMKYKLKGKNNYRGRIIYEYQYKNPVNASAKRCFSVCIDPGGADASHIYGRGYETFYIDEFEDIVIMEVDPKKFITLKQIKEKYNE